MFKRLKISEIRFKIQKLEIFCAVDLDPAIRSTNLNRKKALKVSLPFKSIFLYNSLKFKSSQCLNEILSKTNQTTLQKVPETSSLVRCSLILVQAHTAHFKISRTFFEKKFMKQPFDDAGRLFSSLMQMLIPQKMEIVIDTTMNFLRKEQLWKVECVCVEIFNVLVSCQASPEILMSEMLSYIENMIIVDNIEESRNAKSPNHRKFLVDNFISLPYFFFILFDRPRASCAAFDDQFLVSVSHESSVEPLSLKRVSGR